MHPRPCAPSRTFMAIAGGPRPSDRRSTSTHSSGRFTSECFSTLKLRQEGRFAENRFESSLARHRGDSVEKLARCSMLATAIVTYRAAPIFEYLQISISIAGKFSRKCRARPRMSRHKKKDHACVGDGLARDSTFFGHRTCEQTTPAPSPHARTRAIISAVQPLGAFLCISYAI